MSERSLCVVWHTPAAGGAAPHKLGGVSAGLPWGCSATLPLCLLVQLKVSQGPRQCASGPCSSLDGASAFLAWASQIFWDSFSTCRMDTVPIFSRLGQPHLCCP